MDQFENKVVEKLGGRMYRSFLRNFPPLLLATVLGVCAVMAFYPREHVIVYQIHVQPDPAHPGQLAELVYQANNTEVCDGTVHRWVVDSRGTVFELAPDTALYHSAVSKVEWYRKPFYVPISVAPGPAFYRSHVVRYCNVVQQFIWPTVDDYTVPFTIEAGVVLSPPGHDGRLTPK